MRDRKIEKIATIQLVQPRATGCHMSVDWNHK